MSIQPIYKQLGERIAGLRRSRGLTQEKAAALAGMTRPVLSKVERARIRVQLYSLPAIARALDVTLAQLMPEGRR